MLCQGLTELKHPDQSPLVDLYVDAPFMYSDPTKQGATFAFNVMKSDGTYVPWTDVERMANDARVYIRAGGMYPWRGSTVLDTILTWEQAYVARAVYPRHSSTRIGNGIECFQAGIVAAPTKCP